MNNLPNFDAETQTLIIENELTYEKCETILN